MVDIVEERMTAVNKKNEDFIVIKDKLYETLAATNAAEQAKIAELDCVE